MKQKKTMLIMVVVLAVLLVLYGGLKAWNSHSDRQKKAKEDKEKVSLVVTFPFYLLFSSFPAFRTFLLCLHDGSTLFFI